MPKLTRIAPELPVRNLRASLNYYDDKLGFEVVMEMPDGQYAVLERDDVAVHLFEDATTQGAVGIHVFASEIDELYEEFRRRGADLLQPIVRQPWGNRDFRVRDPDGNILKFTEPAD